MLRIRSQAIAAFLVFCAVPSLASAQYTKAAEQYVRVQAVQGDVDPAGDRRGQTEIAKTIGDATEEMVDTLGDAGTQVGQPVRDAVRRQIEAVRNLADKTNDAAVAWLAKLERRENAWDSCVAVQEQLKELASAWQQLQNEIAGARRVLREGFEEWSRQRQDRMKEINALTKAENEQQKKMAAAAEKWVDCQEAVTEAQNAMETAEEAYDESYAKWEEACSEGNTGAENEERLYKIVANLHEIRCDHRARVAERERNCDDLEKEYEAACAEWDKAQLAVRAFMQNQSAVVQVIQMSNNYLTWSQQFAAEFPPS